MYGFKTPAGQAARKDFTRKGPVLTATPGDEGEDQVRAAASGPVRGPGTGTSDDVQTAVPEGTYIMPADSTEKIGEQKLASLGFTPGAGRSVLQKGGPGLGFQAGRGKPAPERSPGLGFKSADVPVHLSNGEFQLSPEQVHATGVQVLEGLKAATHEPAEEAAEKYEQANQAAGEDPSRPDLFFADGGVVEDPNKRPGATSMTYGDVTSASVPQRQAPAPSPNAGFSTAPAAAPAAPVASSPAAPSAQPKGFLGALGAAYGATVDALTPSPFENRANAIRDKNREGLIAEPGPAAATSPAASQPQATPAKTPAPVVQQPAAAPATPANPNYGNEPNAPANPAASSATPPAAPVGSPTAVPGIQRIDQPGQSPMFTNVGTGGGAAPAAPAGFTPRGAVQKSPDVMGILQREAQIRGEMTPLRDQIAFNNGTGGSFRQLSTDEIVREMLVNGSGRDRAAALGFMSGGRDVALREQAAKAGQAKDQREMDLRQQDLEGRQDIAGQELGIKREAQGFQTRASQRQEALQTRYEAAKTPEERSAIAQQIRDLAGKELPKPDYEMAKARVNLIGELGKQYAAAQPIGEDKRPIPFETWAAPMMRAAGMGAPDLRQREGANVQNRAVGTISTVGNRTAVWDGSKWVEKRETSGTRGALPVPTVGTVIEGHRFRGGNPNDRANWEAI